MQAAKEREMKDCNWLRTFDLNGSKNMRNFSAMTSQAIYRNAKGVFTPQRFAATSDWKSFVFDFEAAEQHQPLAMQQLSKSSNSKE